MIRIGENLDLDALAEDHWDWLKEKLMYDKSDSELQSLDPQKKDISIQKNLALRKMLNPHFSDLPRIVKGNLDDLKMIKSDAFFSKFFFIPDVEIPKIAAKLEKITQLWEVKAGEVKRLRSVRRSNPKDPHIKQLFLNADKERDRRLKLKEKIRGLLNQKETANKIKYQRFKNNTTERVEYFLKDGTRKELCCSLIDLLCYDKLNDGEKWNANILREKLNIAVCPYCNRQYILGTQKIGGGWVTSAQLDHFLPKSNNPLFSCSFFNLIPSCYCCNHIKSDNGGEPMYPYKEGFGDDAMFCIDFDDGKAVDDLNLDDDVIVDIDTSRADPAQKAKINSSISIFHLKELYKKHQQELKNLIKRIQSAKEPRIEEYAIPYFGKKYDDLTPSEKNELFKFLLGLPILLNEEDYPLKKFKTDIIKQIGIHVHD